MWLATYLCVSPQNYNILFNSARIISKRKFLMKIRVHPIRKSSIDSDINLVYEESINKEHYVK